jgi:hypothetical protein
MAVLTTMNENAMTENRKVNREKSYDSFSHSRSRIASGIADSQQAEAKKRDHEDYFLIVNLFFVFDTLFPSPYHATIHTSSNVISPKRCEAYHSQGAGAASSPLPFGLSRKEKRLPGPSSRLSSKGRPT